MHRPARSGHPLLAVVLAIGAIWATPASVLGHAELAGSTPAANASVVEAPESLSIELTEAIDREAAFVDLVDAQQRVVDGVGEVTVSPDGRRLEVALPDLEPGVYTVSYQVVSTVDGHATAGAFAFLVDPTGAAPPPADSARSTSPSVDGLTLAARWLALAALIVALGALVLWWHAGREALAGLAPDADVRPPWRMVGVASLLGAIGIAGYLLLSARPIAAALGPGAGTGIPLDVAGSFGWTPFAVAMRVALLSSMAVAAISVLTRLRGGWVAAAAVLLGVALAGMSMAGHAAASGGPLFAGIDWIHLVAVAAWLGALPAAIVLARRAGESRTPILGAILRRHGRVAIVAAPVVALTGIANSPLVLGRARDLVASDYGNLLVAKAGLLSVALGIGAVNHFALRGRGRAAVATLVGAELLVGAVAVSAAATMVTIQPASVRQEVLAAPPVNPAHLFAEVGPSRVHVAVSVPAPGPQSYRVTVTDATASGPRGDVQKVFLRFTPPPESGLPPARVELESDPLPGLWVGSGAYTPVVGEWQLGVVLRRAGERDEELTFGLPVSAPGDPETGPPPDTGADVPAPLAAVWGLIPAGPAGWLPTLIALGALVTLGLAPASRLRSGARGAALAALLITTAAAGSRTLVAAANAPSDADLARQPAVGSPDLDRGRAVYLANCASCHGRQGDGDGAVRTLPAAGGLGEAVRDASDAELSYRISYGVAGTPMPPFAGLLTSEERADLIGYLRDRWGSR